MSTVIDFGKYYRTITNTELLSVLENPLEYEPAAVEAARIEFERRQLTNEEIKEALEPVIMQRQKQEKLQVKSKNIEYRIKSTGATFLDTINPIQTGLQTIEKTIRLIVIVFSGLFLYQVLSEYKTLEIYLETFRQDPSISLTVILPFVLLPAAILTFWKKWKTGWILLCVYLLFSLVSGLGGLYYSLKRNSSGLESLDNYFERPSPMSFILLLVFFSGMLYVLCRKDMKEKYSISKNQMESTILLASLGSVALLMSVS